MRELSLMILANALIVFANLAFPHIAAANATFVIVNRDGPGEGFNDATPAAPLGGNPGTTLGQQRLNAFQHAANIWSGLLDSPVVIRVEAEFNPLFCTFNSAVLGQAQPNSLHRDFAGAPVSNTWYVQALANSLFGGDLTPTGSSQNDISAEFSSTIGTPGCLENSAWYFGLDGNPPANQIDFVTVLLHELGHGLGFLTFVDLATGAKRNGFDDAYMRHLEDHTTGKTYPQMDNAERAAASTHTENLHWIGANVVTGSGDLSAGRHPSGHVQLYAPSSQDAVSSASHFDTALSPNELMEPFYTGPRHNVGLSLELFQDLGWNVAGAPVNDTTPPAKIADLKAGTASQTSVTLNWSAPGDDDNIGAATSYDLRFTTSKFTDANWGTLNQVSGEPTPGAAGALENTTVDNLLCGKSYFFGIKTFDERGNESVLSNVASAKTAACNNLAVGPMRLPDAEQNVPYDSGPISITNGAPPYGLQILTNTSPEISYDLASGSFKGTPNGPGSFRVTATASDAVGSQRKASFSGKINNPVQITTKALRHGKVSVPYTTTFKANYGVKPYEWEVIPGGLLLGDFQFDKTTGKATLLAINSGMVDLNVKVKSLTGGTATQNLTLEFK